MWQCCQKKKKSKIKTKNPLAQGTKWSLIFALQSWHVTDPKAFAAVFFLAYSLIHFPSAIFFSVLNLLEWHWLTKLYRFQAHNSTTHHLYTVLCVHHPKSVSVHYHVSPYTVLYLPLHTPGPSAIFPSVSWFAWVAITNTIDEVAWTTGIYFFSCWRLGNPKSRD